MYHDVRYATATVEVAEPVTRLLKLHTAQGPPAARRSDVRNFSQQGGDTVTVTYYTTSRRS
jgi:hypothetical protein